MQKGYYAAALEDIRGTQGWFGKLCLLALLNFIPIFGQMVTLGYLYGWARDIAWGLKRPMPAKIFGNEDGKLYSRGFFLLVIAVVFALIPEIIFALSDALGAGAGAGAMYSYGMGSYRGMGTSFGMGMLSGLVWLAGVVVLVLSFFFIQIGSMRAAIYGNLSSGFQVGKIWRMFRYKPQGVWRIFGMYLLVSLIIGAIVSIILLVVGLGAVLGAVSSGIAYSGTLSDRYISMLLSSLGIGIVVLLAIFYFAMVGSLFVQALVARAMGYWTQQFEVEKWQGQDAPMPFETRQAAQAANPYGQQSGAPYGQPYGQRPANANPYAAQQNWQQPQQQTPGQNWNQPGSQQPYGGQAHQQPHQGYSSASQPEWQQPGAGSAQPQAQPQADAAQQPLAQQPAAGQSQPYGQAEPRPAVPDQPYRQQSAETPGSQTPQQPVQPAAVSESTETLAADQASAPEAESVPEDEEKDGAAR